MKIGRMERRLSQVYPQKWVQIGILIGFCMILYFFNLGRWDLWTPDEPRYAQVAKRWSVEEIGSSCIITGRRIRISHRFFSG